MLESYFRLKDHGTNVRTEVVAGLTTFLTMAYIVFVNPMILGDAGMDKGAVFVATCVASAIGTLVMGLYANYPLALAPGMGLNAYFTYGVVKGLHYSWEVALGAVFISGVLFMVLSVTRVREWIVDAIPQSQKMAISAGVGLFLGIIALKNAGIVVASPDTFVTLGNLKAPPTLLAIGGFLLMVALDARKVPGAIIIAILVTTIVGVVSGVSPFLGVTSLPPSVAPTFLKLDIRGALDAGVLVIVFAFFFVDLFDNTGTLVGVAHRAGLIRKDGHIPRLLRVFVADSTATLAGSLLGTSTVTSYIESAAGVRAGGRTGLVGVVVAILFLLTLFFAPLAETVPAYATAPALLYVACLMARGLAEIDWEDVTEYAPAVVTAIAMPLTFSIANGIAFGFILYAAIKLLAGRTREASPAVLVLGLLFLIRFVEL
ncbi:MAG: NCS2 family permease [Alphaproteobacteria bacterium]|nr:NCS2 family permease [Alphaproteobacteria bacterium]MDE1930658.1 NCS2 family permease [Alphaproteobacteria bacterium]